MMMNVGASLWEDQQEVDSWHQDFAAHGTAIPPWRRRRLGGWRFWPRGQFLALVPLLFLMGAATIGRPLGDRKPTARGTNPTHSSALAFVSSLSCFFSGFFRQIVNIEPGRIERALWRSHAQDGSMTSSPPSGFAGFRQAIRQMKRGGLVRGASHFRIWIQATTPA